MSPFFHFVLFWSFRFPNTSAVSETRASLSDGKLSSSEFNSEKRKSMKRKSRCSNCPYHRSSQRSNRPSRTCRVRRASNFRTRNSPNKVVHRANITMFITPESVPNTNTSHDVRLLPYMYNDDRQRVIHLDFSDSELIPR